MSTDSEALRTAKSAHEVAKENYADVKAKEDDDLELETIEDGSEGIPGGTGYFSFDTSDFDLDSAVGRRTPA